jgi:glycosyltransferase involved in cell wall biosynthesis
LRKITVLHFTCTIRRGGSERQLFTIYKFGSQSIRNVIVSIYKPVVSYVEEYNVMPNDIYYILRHNNFLRILYFFKITKLVRPDIVYARDTLSFIIALLVSFILPFKIVNGSIRHGIARKDLSFKVRTFFLHFSKYIIANSFAGLKANKVNRGYVLYNGVDDSFFSVTERNHTSGHSWYSYEMPTFISVGNLVPYKDYKTVLTALTELKSNGYRFRYLIIGEGPNRAAIEGQIKNSGLGNQVWLLGVTANVASYLYEADLFIHSSKGEGCSNAILEAMAAGLPVIVTATGGTPEIVDHKYGRLFDYQNWKQLYTHLAWFIENPDKIRDMSIKARESAIQRFSVGRMISEYEKIMDDITNK